MQKAVGYNNDTQVPSSVQPTQTDQQYPLVRPRVRISTKKATFIARVDTAADVPIITKNIFKKVQDFMQKKTYNREINLDGYASDNNALTEEFYESINKFIKCNIQGKAV